MWDAAALIGTRIELALLESVTSGAAPAIGELLASGLLTVDGMALQFRHEIARLAVEGAVGATGAAPCTHGSWRRSWLSAATTMPR